MGCWTAAVFVGEDVGGVALGLQAEINVAIKTKQVTREKSLLRFISQPLCVLNLKVEQFY